MSRPGDIYNLIVKQQRRLQILKEKRAVKGSNAEPELLIEIEDIEAEIKSLQKELTVRTETEPAGYPTSPGVSPKAQAGSKSKLSLGLTAGVVGLLAVILIAGLAAWFIFLITRRPPTAADGLTASIIDLNPRVEVRHKNTDRLEPVIFGMTVRDEDVIITYANAGVSLICENGHAYKLEAESTMTLDCRDTANTRFIGRLDEALGKQLIGRSETVTLTIASNTTRASRPKQNQLPLLLAPRNTVITETQPTFHWQPVPGATGYRFSLNLADGESWSQETNETSLVYPADAPALAPGSANIVNLSVVDNETAVDKSLLRTLNEAERQTLAQAEAVIRALTLTEAGQAYLLAQLYRRDELWLAAIEQLERLVELETAPSAGPRQELGDLYFEIGLYRQAEENYQATLTAAEAAQDLLAQAAAQVGLARAAHVFEETEAALQHLTLAENLYREAGQTHLADQAAAERAALAQ